MKAIYAQQQAQHAPRFFLLDGKPTRSPEVPQRADVLLQAALDAGCEHQEPDYFGLGPVALLHTPEYIQFLQTIYQRWQTELAAPSEEVIPKIHPDSRLGYYPQDPIGLSGFHMADTSCPIAAHTYSSALRSSHSAATAAQCILQGEPAVYALCRPPGHHAFADKSGGFCFFNNSAVAAEQLRQRYNRVAIIDVDLHHGNGTQGLFYRRKDVLTVSLHADPASFYPFYWGHAHERGEDEGLGFNYNIPLARGSGDTAFLAALDKLLERVAAFDPEAVVVALGLDASIDDPFGGLAVTTDGFAQIGAKLAALGKPTVLVQEGGYLSDSLGANLAACLQSFEQGHPLSV